MFTFAAMLFIVDIHIKETISNIGGTVELRNASTFARVLRDARIREGITQEELAKRVGKSRSWVISVESGRQQPTIGGSNRGDEGAEPIPRRQGRERGKPGKDQSSPRTPGAQVMHTLDLWPVGGHAMA